MAANISAWAQRIGISPAGFAPLEQELAALGNPAALEQSLERLWDGLAAMPGAASALSEPAVQQSLVRLGYAAPFLMRYLIRHPGRLPDGILAHLEDGDAPLPFSAYCAPADCATLDEGLLMSTLRRWKYDNYLRITARDLLNLQDTATTCRQISDLADSMIRVAYRHAFCSQVMRRGLPVLPGGSVAAGLVVGMGKLGGHELNYSSDVDLIFVHGGMSALHPPPRAALPPIDADESPEAYWRQWTRLAEASPGESADSAARGGSSDEFHDHVVRRVTRLLSHKTEDGIGFRVDVDLRPMGRSGQLCPGIGLIEQYYAAQGREWERTAMLKARAVAGSMDLWARFQETIQPFVYRRYLDFGALEGVALVKHDINRHHGSALDANIKLGRGGIRENEFFIQAQQLLYGGRYPELQVTNHTQAIARLVECGQLAADAGQVHEADYWRLRELENRLQMVDEGQVQEMPADPLERTRVVHDFAANFEDRQTGVEAGVQSARDRTAERFASLMQGVGDLKYPEAQIWQAAIRDNLPPSKAAPALSRVDSLMSTLMRTRIGERCVFKLGRLLTDPAQYRVGTAAAFPRWLEFAEQIGNRNAIYSLIEANPAIVEWIGLIFREGGLQAQQLIRHPEFLETYLTLTDSEPGGIQSLLEDVCSRAADEEEFIVDLQMMKSQIAIKILTTYLRNPVARTQRRLLTELADATIAVCTRRAWDALLERHGAPEGLDDPATVSGFAVLAMGKLGSQEMHFQSDLDLVFLYASDGRTSKGRSHFEFFTKLGQKLDSLLTSPTQFGRLYELDHRLRPFGSKGLLVPSLSAYRNFLDAEAEVWNFQAMTRIRHVAGDESLGNALIGATVESWQAARHRPAEIVAGVRDMLERLVADHTPRAPADGALALKYSVGGMIGFEFLRQCLHLLLRARPPESGAGDSPEEGCWTRLREHEMIETLLPLYLELSDLDELLALHIDRYDHRAAPAMFDSLAAVSQRWKFEAVSEIMEQLEQGVRNAFDALAAA